MGLQYNPETGALEEVADGQENPDNYGFSPLRYNTSGEGDWTAYDPYTGQYWGRDATTGETYYNMGSEGGAPIYATDPNYISPDAATKDSSSALAWLSRLFNVGGPSGTGTGAITPAMAGLGGTGILAALAALTSKPSTTSGVTSQTGTTGQTTAGTTGQTQKVGFDQWYENMVKAQAEGIPTKGYESFDKDMLNLPNGRAIADYMSPYMEQVANPIMRRQAEDQAAQQQKFAAERVSRGAFGSGRSDILSNQLQERQALERDNTLSGIYNQAFGSATGLAGQDLGRSFEDWKLLQAGGAGTVGQATAQGNLLKGLAPGATTTVAGTTAGTTSGTTGTSGTTSYTGADPNRLGQLAGISGTIWGMANPNGLKP